MRKAVYLCLTTVVLAATALSQSATTTQAQQEDKVVVGTNLVTLNVIVTDSKGRYVKGLSRDQFDVYDNKVKQQIDQLTGNRRWFFEDITRPGGRRSFLLNSDAAIGRAVLAEMSRVSGGATHFPETESESELAGICTQIALELRQQYTLGFYSKAADAHIWHKLKVRVSKTAGGSDLTLTYREGYQIAASVY